MGKSGRWRRRIAVEMDVQGYPFNGRNREAHSIEITQPPQTFFLIPYLSISIDNPVVSWL
jgi:hypothetical protein